jgi:hypothetical protein
MKGIVSIWEISTIKDDYGRVEVEVSFTIEYEDYQSISTKLSFCKHNYSYLDIITCIQRYFKGELQFK